jgi:hypothetical protein
MAYSSSGSNPDELQVMPRRRDIEFRLLEKAFCFNALIGCGGYELPDRNLIL